MNDILQQFRPGHREDLITCMQAIQDKEGYISRESIRLISNYFKIPAIKVYGIATFYDYFTFAPTPGHIVRICNGTSCHMNGSGKLISEAEKLQQINSSKGANKFTLKRCECRGACGAGPVMQVNGKSFTRVKHEEVRVLIERNLNTKRGGLDE